MFTGILLFGALLLGQTGDAVFGGYPSDVPTFKLSVNGADQEVLLQAGGQWFTGGVDDLPVNNIGVSYVPDTPWLAMPDPAPRVPRGATLTPEANVMRKERLKRAWAAEGYVFIKSATGEEMPVKKDYQPVVQTALEETARVEKRAAPDNLSLATAQVASAAPAGAAQPTWRGYIGHLILIVVVLIVGAVIVKVLLLNDDEWDRVG